MSRYPFITTSEVNSILYYQGAVDNIELDTSDDKLIKFYKIRNAYETLNVLLFPGIENENARLNIEKRNMDNTILDSMEELLNIYCSLYSAMCKYTLYTKKGKTISTFRDDRKNTVECMKKGTNDSFMSTTLNANRQSNYFQNKDGLVLMDFVANDTIEHIDINDVLGAKSLYSGENEILYPPFLCIKTEAMTLTDEEQILKDIHGRAPFGKYLITISGTTINMKKATERERQWLEEQKNELIDKSQVENIKIVWKSIKDDALYGKEKQIDQYLAWKQKLRLYLKVKFSIIKYEICKTYK